MKDPNVRSKGARGKLDMEKKCEVYIIFLLPKRKKKGLPYR